jgi:ABC-type sugar transport system substrate-binding protein
MQNIVTANPDIAGVFCKNDEMALGAVQAVNARSLSGKVAIVGIDGSPDAVTASRSRTADHAQLCRARSDQYCSGLSTNFRKRCCRR